MENRSAFDSGYAAPGRETNPALFGMLAILLMVTLAAGFFGWKSVREERENQRLQAEVDGLMAELEQKAQEANRNQDALASAQQEVERLQAELGKVQSQWAERQREWERRDAENRQRLQRSFEALASVVNDSGSALDYLREMEAKVREGQALGQEDLEDLKVIGKGLALLQAQYERPLEEFKQLEESIARELENGASSPPSAERKFLRAMFDWKYRERQKVEKAEMLKEQGRREALEDTQQQLAQRYARAQQEMAAVKSQFGEHLRKLDGVVGSGATAVAEMASFFQVSAEVIKIHQRAMNIQVEPVPAPLAPIFSGADGAAIKP